MSLQCHIYPNSMIHQGIKDQVQYNVTEMQESVVEMGYVIGIGSVMEKKNFDVISFITTVLSILPLISCGGWENSVLPSAPQKG